MKSSSMIAPHEISVVLLIYMLYNVVLSFLAVYTSFKRQCHDNFAVLGQFYPEITILSAFTHTQNAPL